MVSSSWGHGYPTASAYTCGYYRELAPNWLDLAALVKGFSPARRTATARFRYLDLGCGMGFGLALLASLYPEGEFIGVDFQPDHLAHAHDLRERLSLPNLLFIQGDFLELAGDPAALGHFHYIVSHGIASWIIPKVQSALLALASDTLAPNGIFYCSYNCLPGWLAGSVLQALVSVETARSDASTPVLPVNRAAASLRELLGDGGNPSPLAMAQPTLREHLERLPSLTPAYLSQEYGCAGWQPLYAFQFHQRCLEHKLRFVGTATLPELSDDILPQQLLGPIRREANPMIRETLLDIASNKSFRRDLFMKGLNPMPSHEREAALSQLLLRLQEAPPQDSYLFPTTYGAITGKAEHYRAMENELRSGPRTLGDLSVALDRPEMEVLGMALLLIHSSRVGMDRGEAASLATTTCQRITPILQDLVQGGRPYDHLPIAEIGSAIPFSVVDALVFKTLSEGLDPELAAPCIQVGLHAIGRRLKDPQGKPYEDDSKEYEAITALMERFRSQRLPALEALGVPIG